MADFNSAIFELGDMLIQKALGCWSTVYYNVTGWLKSWQLVSRMGRVSSSSQRGAMKFEIPALGQIDSIHPSMEKKCMTLHLPSGDWVHP
jgi:hypothetical protein